MGCDVFSDRDYGDPDGDRMPEEWARARPSMGDVLLESARLMAARSTCPHARVGTVVAREGRVLSSGYNGSPAGMEHCTHGPRRPGDEPVTCPTSVHAEANAVAFAARHGTALEGATLYTTLTPCRPCAQLIIQAGITGVVAAEWYRDQSGVELLRDAFVSVIVRDGP